MTAAAARTAAITAITMIPPLPKTEAVVSAVESSVVSAVVSESVSASVFYATRSFYSLKDLKKQLAVHNRKYNNFPMRPLNWKSPADYVSAFVQNGEVF